MGRNRYCLDYDDAAKKAFAEATTDGKAVLAIILSMKFRNHHNLERMVETVLWMVSTGGERHKYNTRYFSMNALKTQRMISDLVALKKAIRQKPPITDETIQQQRQSELIPLIARLAATPSGANIAADVLGAEVRKYTKLLRHEHVHTRQSLRRRLLKCNESIASVVDDTVGCVVTVEEHRKLKDTLQGWKRYRDAHIEVFDREEETKFRI